jgi:ubiquinone/menaquinone biosynthesis C-methylase UbiE
LSVEYGLADAEALAFADATFDVVVSTFGVMFTPNQDKAALELLRVCKRQDWPRQLDAGGFHRRVPLSVARALSGDLQDYYGPMLKAFEALDETGDKNSGMICWR